jgi:hypothetical protein
MDRVAFPFSFWQGARMEHSPSSVTDEQRRQKENGKQPEGPGGFWPEASSLTPHVATAMLLARFSPPAKIPPGAIHGYS